jgi:hypothetical protein
MLQIKPIVQSQFFVQASPFAHYFLSFSGIRDTAATSQYASGFTQRVYNLKGPKTLSECTVSAAWDPVQMADIVDYWKASTCDFLSLTITPVTCGENPQPLGTRTIIIPDAQMTSLNFGQVDRTSGNPSTIELTFVGDNFLYS